MIAAISFSFNYCVRVSFKNTFINSFFNTDSNISIDYASKNIERLLRGEESKTKIVKKKRIVTDEEEE